MKRKILIGVGIFFVLLIGAIVILPIMFKDQIKAKIEKSINENLNAKVSFEDADLSLLKNFPNASVTLEKLLVLNIEPFVGDTLVAADEISLHISISEVFKLIGSGNDPASLKSFSVKNGKANILFNEAGIGNFDIVKKTDEKEETKSSSPFSMDIQKYSIENFNFKYYDVRSKIKMEINELNHFGKGNFANQVLDLDTKTTTKMSLEMDKMNYMKNVALSLDAVLGIDLDKLKFTFKNNTAKINQLPLEFNGFLQMLDNGQSYDITFKTPTSSFKNFLGLIPAAYAASISNVKTTGEFTVNGFAKGMLTDDTIPKFNITINSNNASFKYPDLPKTIQDIVIHTNIVNNTGIINDTYVDLNEFSFRIDQDKFFAKANIKNVVTNALVEAALKGTINLGNISKAYPVKLDMPLSGILTADVTTKFDMSSVENSKYENIQNSGNLSLTGFNYSGKELAKPIQISKATVAFNTKQIKLNELALKTGQSDMKMSGTLDNFYGFLFKNQVLKGNFSMNSNQFLVSDFMVPSTESPAKIEPSKEKAGNKKASQAVKIPSFLDCTITATANTVVYDNLTLKAVSGKMIIKEEAINLKDLKTNIFDGQIKIDGLVSTKGNTSTFNMNLDLNQVDITKSFTQLEMLKKLAPIAEVVKGKLNSNIKLSGNLDAVEMTPDLKTVSGDLVGQLFSTTVVSEKSQMLSALTSNVKFLDMNKLNLNDVKAALSFKNGKVNVKPFKVKYNDIVAEIGGEHGFDQSMNYNIKMNVPAKYLGNEVNSLIAKLTPSDAKKIDNLPVTALMTGNFKSPKVTTDLKQATKNLTTQIVQLQKEKLLNQGTSALSNLLGGGKKNPSDSTKTEEPKKNDIKNTAGELINGLFGKKKKKE